MDLRIHPGSHVSRHTFTAIRLVLTIRIQLGDFNHPMANGSLAISWRDRLSTSVPGDPAVRDRDLKLLAWLEYVEMLRDSESTTFEAWSRLTFSPSSSASLQDSNDHYC
jgi:hypothetical protein